MLTRHCTALIAVVGLAPSPAPAGIFGNAPDAIVCSFVATANRPGGILAFHVDARVEDGTLLYKTLGVTPLQLIVGADGVIEAEKIAECHGKTLRELRDAGRAFDFH